MWIGVRKNFGSGGPFSQCTSPIVICGVQTSARCVVWVGGCLSLCSRLRAVTHTPQLAYLCTLSCPRPTGRSSRCGHGSMSTLHVVRGARVVGVGTRGGGAGINH